ncbi:hypothetical protein PTKIN_Ptkin16aG0477000 [Pterospermum kingtungense]
MVPSGLEEIEGNKLSTQNSTPKEDEKTNMDQKGGGWTTSPFIIGTMVGFSLGAGGWGANLIVFLITEFHVKNITAMRINNVILGCNNLLPIAVGSLQCSTPSKLQFAVLFKALALASLGIGGTRFTIATMGAHQFHEPKDQGIFFNWYFLALYVASSICFTAIIYIQDNLSWGLAFGICVVANAIALVLFSSGKRFYQRIKPHGSPFTSILRVVFAVILKRSVPNTFGSQEYNYGSLATTNILQNGPSKSFR